MPKIVDRDEYKKTLLEKCFTLFTRKGYSRVTMREIAREIDVSTGTLYHYFPTKESILEQMFAYVQETNMGDYLFRTERVDSRDKRIDIFSETWKEYGEYYQNVLLLAVDVFRNALPEHSEKILHEFSEYFTERISERLEIPEQGAQSLFIYLLGLVLHSMLTPNTFSFNEQVDVLKSFLKAGIPDMIEKCGNEPGNSGEF